MGIGDEIMVTALAKKYRRQNNIPSVVLNGKGFVRRHPVFDNNPWLLNSIINQNKHVSEFTDRMVNRIYSGEGAYRHYINEAKSKPHEFYVFEPWEIEPGEIYFSEQEQKDLRTIQFYIRTTKEHANNNKKIVLVEPTIKSVLQSNKLWLTQRWQELIRLLRKENYGVIQMHHKWSDKQMLKDVTPLGVYSVREMLCTVQVVDAFISVEGGVHHAAAALNKPGAVIFGGFISPEITGYKMHTNITHATAFCGNLRYCKHCSREMLKITPEEVFEKFNALMRLQP